MRKMLVVAAREYQAAVRTKTFLLSLLIMPFMMGGSIILQVLLQDVVDTGDKRYALIDRAPAKGAAKVIRDAVTAYNATIHAGKQQVRAKLFLEEVPPRGATKQEQGRQRYELSERVRQGELLGFLEILDGDDATPPAGISVGPGDGEKPYVLLRYESNRPDPGLAELARKALTRSFRTQLAKKSKLTEPERRVLMEPVAVEAKGLSVLDPKTGKVEEGSDQSRIAAIVAPVGLTMLMFMVVLMGATPLMQGVVEEKMQRIAEVLLGSVRPFELMMGKLIGMAGVSLTITAVYLGGAYWAALHYGFAESLGWDLLLWFVAYQVLAALMYGSLFIAIGAACTEMKETQNLLLPVMLLVSLPMFIIGSVLREPNNPVAVGMSFFPFATPMLMLTRMGIPPGVPWWQPVVGVVLVLLTTVLCVWAAGRIFRVGILMQGKGARLGEMFKWVFRG